jgi:hypothetical protein
MKEWKPPKYDLFFSGRETEEKWSQFLIMRGKLPVGMFFPFSLGLLIQSSLCVGTDTSGHIHATDVLLMCMPSVPTLMTGWRIAIWDILMELSTVQQGKTRGIYEAHVLREQIVWIIYTLWTQTERDFKISFMVYPCVRMFREWVISWSDRLW